MKVRTRFAPSPTGKLHLGSVRTALYNWLYARHMKGEFLLRIEDTDRERSTQESTQLILDSMAWLGMDYDIGPIYQSDRLEIYRAAAEKLIEKGLAYRCYCTKERLDNLRAEQLANKAKPRYDGCCRDKNLPPRTDAPYVIRFKNPTTGTVNFTDQVLGNLTFKNEELDDLIIIKSDGYPTYNFCVVIDDLAMEITHVVRGADHVNNTPRQINIYHALNATPPEYAHIPLILGKNGKLLSKRDGAASILQYRAEGYLHEALLNYLVRLGWSHGDQEIFSTEEMFQLFEIRDINRAAASFDPEKFLWLNRHYLKTLDPQQLVPELIPHFKEQQINLDNGPELTEVILALRERASTLVELTQKSRYFYEDFSDYEEKAKKFLSRETSVYIAKFADKLAALTTWNDDAIHQTIEATATDFAVKLGKVAQPLRVAVTGSTISPPLNTTLRLIGKERSLARLAAANVWIEQNSVA